MKVFITHMSRTVMNSIPFVHLYTHTQSNVI